MTPDNERAAEVARGLTTPQRAAMEGLREYGWDRYNEVHDELHSAMLISVSPRMNVTLTDLGRSVAHHLGGGT